MYNDNYKIGEEASTIIIFTDIRIHYERAKGWLTPYDFTAVFAGLISRKQTELFTRFAVPVLREAAAPAARDDLAAP